MKVFLIIFRNFILMKYLNQMKYKNLLVLDSLVYLMIEVKLLICYFLILNFKLLFKKYKMNIRNTMFHNMSRKIKSNTISTIKKILNLIKMLLKNLRNFKVIYFRIISKAQHGNHFWKTV